jgi:hypothetical protein
MSWRFWLSETAPGVSFTRSVKLRPLRGTEVTRCSSMDTDWETVAVSRVLVEAITSTVAVASALSRLKLATAVTPRVTWTFSSLRVRLPGAVTVTS